MRTKMITDKQKKIAKSILIDCVFFIIAALAMSLFLGVNSYAAEVTEDVYEEDSESVNLFELTVETDDPFDTDFNMKLYHKTDSIFEVVMEEEYDMSNLSQEAIDAIEVEKWKDYNNRVNKKTDYSFAFVATGVIVGIIFLWRFIHRG